jgi:hypothetical protein
MSPGGRPNIYAPRSHMNEPTTTFRDQDLKIIGKEIERRVHPLFGESGDA